VTPSDAAGNVGSTYTGSETFSDTDPCAGTTPADACSEADSVDAEADPAVDAIADDDDSGAFRRDTSVPEFRLVSHATECDAHRCWITERSKEQSSAIGNTRVVYAGDDDDVDHGSPVYVSSIIKRVDHDNGWLLGGLNWARRRVRLGSGHA
jgi:hypothetical protein